jgi:hypothetical protein
VFHKFSPHLFSGDFYSKDLKICVIPFAPMLLGRRQGQARGCQHRYQGLRRESFASCRPFLRALFCLLDWDPGSFCWGCRVTCRRGWSHASHQNKCSTQLNGKTSRSPWQILAVRDYSLYIPVFRGQYAWRFSRQAK